MAEVAGRGAGRGGFGRGRGRGGRGRDGGRGRGRGRGETVWVPCTKLGRLVAANKIDKLEEIYKFALPIKEPEIIDKFFPKDAEGKSKLQDEVMKVMPVQKQTRAGQRTRFKAFVVVGDEDGHVGLGTKCSKEVATAIKEALAQAKINLVPVRRGYWGNKIGLPHTVPMKATGKCGSVIVRLIPAPRGAGLVAAPATKKILSFAGIHDVYTQSRGCTRTMGNFIKACFFALSKTHAFLTPDMWAETDAHADLYQQHTDYLRDKAKTA
eukprot:TRINITY_DN1235_c0_g2_i1.p1 TRINITY_DN1235_c0_g2~~TRINITY_DN1235_c0_g2_i1.p1  ORF type:complete len:277 (+),score=63.78 TRINITY_DN1235_c0_g2_i1:33-833(+)